MTSDEDGIKLFVSYILQCCCEGNHADENQSPLLYAPKPRLPEASLANSKSGTGSHSGRSKNETPFHNGRNSFHHSKSSCQGLLRRIYRRRGFESQRRLIMRRKKVRPWATTAQAWLSLPTSDSSSLRVHPFFPCPSANNYAQFLAFIVR